MVSDDLYLKQAMFLGKIRNGFSHWIQRIRRIGKPWKEEHVMWPGVSFRIIVLPQQGSKTSKEKETKKKIKLWRNKKERRQCMRNGA